MLFRLSEVHKSYGAQDVLRGASLQVNPGEHVGLVGRNGAGKTTVFRLITGEEAADQGDVVRARGVRLGLLGQHVHFEPGTTVHESALAAFGHLQQIEHEMHELEHRMAEPGDELEGILARYSDLQHDFEREGGFEYAAKAEAILQGLGFEREVWSLETQKLSGGQQNRLGLARLLLAAPDVLLLDEPTSGVSAEEKFATMDRVIHAVAPDAATIVFVEHDMEIVSRYADRVVAFYQGRILADGDPRDVLKDPEVRRYVTGGAR